MIKPDRCRPDNGLFRRNSTNLCDLLNEITHSKQEGTKKIPSIIPDRIEANPDNTEQGLAKMVLTLIEIIRKLLERQAIRRVEGGTLSEQEIERLGLTLMKLENKMDELKQHFQLTDDDLTIDLGPIGELM